MLVGEIRVRDAVLEVNLIEYAPQPGFNLRDILQRFCGRSNSDECFAFVSDGELSCGINLQDHDFAVVDIDRVKLEIAVIAHARPDP